MEEQLKRELAEKCARAAYEAVRVVRKYNNREVSESWDNDGGRTQQALTEVALVIFDGELDPFGKRTGEGSEQINEENKLFVDIVIAVGNILFRKNGEQWLCD